MAQNTDRLLTSHDIGNMLQMDPSSIVKWVNDGILPAYLTPGGHRRIKSSDLLRFLRAHKMYIPPELESGSRRVLIVNDDEKALKNLERGLKPYGDRLAVSTSNNGIDALVQIGAQPPDVLVLDVNIPGIDGLQLLEKLKANPVTSGTEVVLIAPRPTPDLEKKAKALGAKLVMREPVGAAELKDVIDAAPAPRT